MASWSRNVQHTIEKRTGLKPQNPIIILAVVGIAVSLILSALYLSQVAAFATTNREIEDLIVERDRLERSVEQLRADIASLQTIPELKTRAEELGFRPATPTDIEYMVVNGFSPLRERTVVPQDAQQEELVPIYDETFLGWIQQQIDSFVGDTNSVEQ